MWHLGAVRQVRQRLHGAWAVLGLTVPNFLADRFPHTRRGTAPRDLDPRGRRRRPVRVDVRSWMCGWTATLAAAC